MSGAPGQAPRNPQGARAVGETVANWTRAANNQQPMMAPLGMAGPQGYPGAPPMPGQSMRGQAGAQAVGDAAISWTRPDGTVPPGYPQGYPGGPGAMMPPGAMGQPGMMPVMAPLGMAGPQGQPGAAPMPGQSMRGQAGAQAIGDGAVSWMGKNPQQPGVMQAMPGMQGAPGMPGMPGQSMMGQAGAQGVGGAAVSWMGKQQQPQPGGVAQSMLGAQAAGPGGPAVSQLTGEITAPGQAAVSLLDGTTHAAQPGQSMMQLGASGGPGQAPGAAAAEGHLVDAKADGGVMTHDGRGPRAEAELIAENAKGTAGGPAGVSGAPGAGEEELVDPDADRPNFGASGEDEAAAAEEEAEDEAFASVAARAKPAKRLEASKPMDPAYVTAMVMGAAILALGLLIFAGRGILMDMWPSMAGFYQRIGAEPKHVGDGLKIAESSKRLQRIGGIETLVVRGFVSNISDVPQAVPNLKLELYNEKHEVIQDAGVKACAALLDPRGTCDFEVKLELPQVAAAKGGYAVVWAK